MKLKFYQNFLSKRIVLTVIAGIAFCLNSFSQINQTPSKCGNELDKMADQYPGFWKALYEFESNWERYKNHVDLKIFEQTTSGKYIIPVVVHVLHLGSTENITAAQIKTQITVFNRDFKMENPAIGGISSFAPFDTVCPYFNGDDTTYVVHGTDTSSMLNRFEFRLATLDPFGNCTDGIVRVYTEKSELAGDFSKFKQISSWDRAKYFNIWIVNDILGNTPGQTTLGYAQFPFAFGGQFPLTSTDGITVISNFFGTSGTASGGTGATSSHEVGHWLGLFHIWGDAECGSDGIDDTPLHFGPNFSSSACFPLPKTATCYTDTNSTDTALNAEMLNKRFNIGEMWMNIMDYTDDQCLWMFTEQQYRKMNVTMETISFRGGLSDPANVIATGTDDVSQATLCTAAPIANLWSTTGATNYIVQKLICAGGSLTFTDGTFNLSNIGSDPHTRVWDFLSGTPATSTTSSQAVVYNTPGIYDVTVTSTNVDGTSTKTRSQYVRVSSTTADEANYSYYDDFEYSTSLYEQGKWIILSQGVTPAATWTQATNTGYLSSKCAVMQNTNNIQYEKDFLITPSYDLTTLTGEKLYFKFAGARKTTTPWAMQNDVLKVYTSTNCGSSWTPRQIKVDGVLKSATIGLKGDTLYSAGLFTDGFVPTAANHWNEGEVDLVSVTGQANVRIMFEWTSDGPYGNDFYIDQINISNSTSIGIEDQLWKTDYSIYPNPVTGTSQIYFSILEDSKVTLDVVDITGRTVKIIYSGDLKAGDQFYQLLNSDFNSAGIYMVRLNVDGVTSTKKVIIE